MSPFSIAPSLTSPRTRSPPHQSASYSHQSDRPFINALPPAPPPGIRPFASFLKKAPSGPAPSLPRQHNTSCGPPSRRFPPLSAASRRFPPLPAPFPPLPAPFPPLPAPFPPPSRRPALLGFR
ncbi:hypothetical protein DFH09DRAFT_1318286 [Mycena vulgaris]|nr:hypothetical protein DFH09DRAFT_1318286 [Mycena vulgaris]